MRRWMRWALWVPDGAANGSLVPGVLYSAGHEGPAWRWDGAEDWLVRKPSLRRPTLPYIVVR